MFLKQKMYLGSFCRVICSDIIQLPYLSYETYLQNTSKGSLAKEEYEALNNQLPNYRLLLLMSGLMQKSSEGKIKQTDNEIGEIFLQALKLAYEDNNYSKDETISKLESFGEELDNFICYLGTTKEEEIQKNGFIFHASMYFSTKFDSFMNGKDESHNKFGTLLSLTNNNRKLTKSYFESAFKKVKIIDNEFVVNNKQSNITIQYSFEFNQILSKIKTNYDQHTEKLDDNLLIISLTSFCARFFHIADDRQFYLIKSYLLDLYSSKYNTKDELYELEIPKNIFSLIFNSLNDNERNAALNLFGNGKFHPFKTAPVLYFGKDAYENDIVPFKTYKFNIEVKNNSVKYNLKMPAINPSKLFVPLALGYMIEFVYLNLKEDSSFEKSKKVILDMLELINNNKFSEYNLVNGVLIKNKII